MKSQFTISGLFLASLLSLVLISSATARQVWTTTDLETEYFGEVTKYDIQAGEVTILKADGKEFQFEATELDFSGKWQLIWTDAFGQALKQDYQTPLAPLIMLTLLVLALIAIPTLIGLWGAAHVLGAVASPGRHLGAFLKVTIIALAIIITWLVVSIVMDPEMPIIPDRKADGVLIAFLAVFGPLFSSVVLSFHYHRPWWKGMAITFLGSAFASIVLLALLLTGLYLATRMEAETLVDRTIFQPFGLF